MNWTMLFTVIKHLFIWLIIIFIMSVGDLSWGWVIDKSYETFWPQTYGAITNAIIFYFTSFYLIPKFFNKRLRKQFYGYSLLLMIVVLIAELMMDNYWGAYYQDKAFLRADAMSFFYKYLDGLYYVLPINIFYWMMAFVYRIPIDRKIAHERELQLQREKLEAELKFLKYQMHPHTLFNGMNSIYHLIETNPDKAKELTLNLSNSLRYQLYESGGKYVPLEKEINYLQQYIALNEVRIAEDTVIEKRLEDDERTILIAPLLFTPFIENAFKYISHHSKKEDNQIVIKLETQADKILFYCMNTFEDEKERELKIGGIGLENVKNRLALLYDNTYQLTIEKKKNKFEVNLQIPIKEN